MLWNVVLPGGIALQLEVDLGCDTWLVATFVLDLPLYCYPFIGNLWIFDFCIFQCLDCNRRFADGASGLCLWNVALSLGIALQLEADQGCDAWVVV